MPAVAEKLAAALTAFQPLADAIGFHKSIVKHLVTIEGCETLGDVRCMLKQYVSGEKA